LHTCEKKEKISQYEGVSWHSQRYKWYARLRLKYQIPKYGGCFNSELDAARRVNQMCEEMKIPLRNSGISAIPTQQCQVIYNYFLSQDIYQQNETGF
jgi:hypothetical protein